MEMPRRAVHAVELRSRGCWWSVSSSRLLLVGFVDPAGALLMAMVAGDGHVCLLGDAFPRFAAMMRFGGSVNRPLRRMPGRTEHDRASATVMAD
jgi:hypothetical protein